MVELIYLGLGMKLLKQKPNSINSTIQEFSLISNEEEERMNPNDFSNKNFQIYNKKNKNYFTTLLIISILSLFLNIFVYVVYMMHMSKFHLVFNFFVTFCSIIKILSFSYILANNSYHLQYHLDNSSIQQSW